MERLTKHSKQTSHENGICCTHFRGPECLGVGGNCAMNCRWEEAAWSRLAAYEDTRMEPEEITAMQHTLDEYHKVADPLLRAQTAGRLVVLPCKGGDTVYFALLGRIIEKQVFSIVSFSNSTRIYCGGTSEYFRPEDIGKTFFLTREEAEKALEAMKK